MLHPARNKTVSISMYCVKKEMQGTKVRETESQFLYPADIVREGGKSYNRIIRIHGSVRAEA